MKDFIMSWLSIWKSQRPNERPIEQPHKSQENYQNWANEIQSLSASVLFLKVIEIIELFELGTWPGYWPWAGAWQKLNFLFNLICFSKTGEQLFLWARKVTQTGWSNSFLWRGRESLLKMIIVLKRFTAVIWPKLEILSEFVNLRSLEILSTWGLER